MITFHNLDLPFAKDAVVDWKNLPSKGIQKLTFFDEGVDLECLTAILVQIGRRDDPSFEPYEKGLGEVEFLSEDELDYYLYLAKLKWNAEKEQIFNMPVHAMLFNGTFSRPCILPIAICFEQKQLPLEITWAHPIEYYKEEEGQLAVGIILYGSVRDNDKKGKEKVNNAICQD